MDTFWPRAVLSRRLNPPPPLKVASESQEAGCVERGRTTGVGTMLTEDRGVYHREELSKIPSRCQSAQQQQ